MTWFTTTTATATNGSPNVNVKASTVIGVKAGDALIIGSFPAVEILSTTTSGPDNIIVLVTNWDNTTQNDVDALVLPTGGNFKQATDALVDATTITADNFKSMDTWGTGDGTPLTEQELIDDPTAPAGYVYFKGKDQNTYIARTMVKMDSDVQETQDNLIATIDADMDDKIDAQLDVIRYSKINDPLCSLFKKNQLVEKLKGNLSATRASGATYIDRYGVLRYSPSTTATNLCLWSEDFSNAVYNNTNVTINSGVAIGADGTLSLSSVTPTSTSGVLVRQNFAGMTQDVSVTIAVFFKRREGASAPLVSIAFYDWANVYHQATYSYETFGIESTNGDVAASYVDLGNDVIRLSLTMKTGNGATTPNFRLQVNGPEIGVDSHFFGQISVEESKVANGYVKTEATSVTGTSSFGITQMREEKDGWLLEGESTNVTDNSENLDAHQKVGVTITEGVATYAGLSFNDLIEDSAVSVHEYRVYPEVTNGVKTTCSIFGKANNRDFLALKWSAGGGAETAVFDLITGVIVSVGGTATAEIEAMSDGVYRCSMTITPTDTVESNIRVQARVNSGDESYQGSGTSAIFVTGHQTEPLPFASSYIPTEGTAMTRVIDTLTSQGAGNMPKLSEAHTIVFTTKTLGNTGVGTNQAIFSAFGDDGFNRSIGYWGGSDISILNYVSGVNSAPVITGQNNRHDFVFTYDGITADTFEDGILIDSDAVAYTDSIDVASILYFGSEITGRSLFGHIQNFAIYDFVLNPDESRLLAGE